MNPLYHQMAGTNILQQFNQFRQAFKGDPQRTVQQMLESGRISQDQYNRAVQMANQFMKTFSP